MNIKVAVTLYILSIVVLSTILISSGAVEILAGA